jgi:FkbM family methyltransferase
LDVGASAIAEVPIYKTLLDKKLAHLNAFEGDSRQIEGIKKAYAGQVTFYHDFLYDGSIQTIYLASGPSGMTSLLKPDIAALKFFNGFENFGHIENTEQVKTKKLDDIEDLPLIDFLKMDIQGAELMALRGASDSLTFAKALYLEVNEKELYKGCGQIEEIDTFLAPYKFKRVLTKMTSHGWGDALYIIQP